MRNFAILARAVDRCTGGELNMELLPTKSVVPHRETIDAAGAGMPIWKIAKQVAADLAGTGSPIEEVVDWTQAERDKFRAIAVGAWEDFSKKSPLTKEAYDAHISYMKAIGLLN